jgi:hypothetical protein
LKIVILLQLQQKKINEFFFEDKIVGISLRVEGLFVLRPVADLDFDSIFNLWA